MCLAPNEVDAGVNIGLPGQPGTGFGGTPSSGVEDTIQVYEDRNGNEVVEIMSETEDIKVYQNPAGDEVIEIGSRNTNSNSRGGEGKIESSHQAQQRSSMHKIQQHHYSNP